MIFSENIWISLKISLEICPQGSNKLYSTIDLDNYLAPTSRQTINSTNGG